MIPEARSGLVRHPKGRAALKSGPDNKSGTVATLKNGAPVDILARADRWFEVRQAGTNGFLHETRFRFESTTEAPSKTGTFKLGASITMRMLRLLSGHRRCRFSAYLVSSGWLAITLKDTYSIEGAVDIMKILKARGAVRTTRSSPKATPMFARCAVIDEWRGAERRRTGKFPIRGM